MHLCLYALTLWLSVVTFVVMIPAEIVATKATAHCQRVSIDEDIFVTPATCY